MRGEAFRPWSRRLVPGLLVWGVIHEHLPAPFCQPFELWASNIPCWLEPHSADLLEMAFKCLGKNASAGA